MKCKTEQLSAGQKELKCKTEQLSAGQKELKCKTEQLSAGQKELKCKTEQLSAGQKELKGEIKGAQEAISDVAAHTQKNVVRLKECHKLITKGG